ncbi:MAG: putative glycerol acyltransferase [Paenibacillus sp.]|jgi:1-acyl-sn-glycerol-3-phosphate acyltransferase|nr:putative glycerol acyltransferase [Paenibacillus sp.]
MMPGERRLRAAGEGTLILADKQKWFNKLFYLYNKHWLLPRFFHSIEAVGAVDAEPGASVLYIMNHCSWWDGLLVYHATQNCSLADHYMMMDREQLAHYPFFRKLGAFSIDKSSLGGITASLDYASSLMRQGRAVWLFPQGAIEHQEKRPIAFQSGVGALLCRCPQTAVIPVTVYYSVSNRQKLLAELEFGKLMKMDWPELGRRRIAAMLHRSLEDQLELQRARIIRGERLLDETERETGQMRRILFSSEGFAGIGRGSQSKGVGLWRSPFGPS